MSALANEILEPQINGFSTNFGSITAGGNSPCQDQIIENYSDDKIRKAVDNAVTTVENRVHDAILTAMDNVLYRELKWL